MFAYCNSNPVNALDPRGKDAIWLQDIDNAVAGYLGHTGLLIQDLSGKWYYFNWTNSTCYCWEVDPLKYDYTSLDSLMEVDGNRYDASIYFKGDCSASLEYAEDLKKNSSAEDYSLIGNNCMQVVTDVLMQGEFEQNDLCYTTMLHKARNSIIPNVSYSRIVNFYNAEQVYTAAPEWAKWLYTSPGKAALTY